MIVYEATRGEFTEDVFSNAIEAKILAAFQQRLGHSTSRAVVPAKPRHVSPQRWSKSDPADPAQWRRLLRSEGR